MNSLRNLWLLCGLALLPAAQGQAVPRLDSVTTTAFQRGTHCRSHRGFRISGKRHAGVSNWPEPCGSPGLRHHPRRNVGVRAESPGGGHGEVAPIRLQVDADAPLGSRELRATGPGGVSNPITVNLSDVSEVQESQPNQKPGEGPLIALPAAVSGVISGSAETDHFRFAARAGQKLSFDVQANRFGSPLDPTLVVMDASGKELARSEDAHGLDPFLEFTVPADGEYSVRIHDLRFQGGGDYRYRILAGDLPYLEFLFPFGGRRGSTVQLRLDGRNLEGAETMSLQVASDAPLGRQDIRARTSRGLSNPQPFEAGDLPETAEMEPNNATNNATAIEVPGVVNGVIGEPNDVDQFRFTSAVDQKLVAEVQARRFGSPLDALLTLTDAQGTVLQRNDDSGGPDARIEFDAKKDVEYRLALRDLTDRGGNRFGYRLTVQPPNTAPDFGVRVPGGRFRIARGARTAIRCEVDRRNGFDGIIRVQGDSLPAGVSAAPLVLGLGSNFGWLVLTASDDADAGPHPLALTTIGEQAGRQVRKPVSFGEGAWLTVLPVAAIGLEVAQSTLLAEQNAGTSLDVGVTRREGFDGEIRVLAEDLPGVSIPSVTIPRGQSRARLAVQPAYNAEVGIRPLMVRAEAIEPGVTNVTYASQAVPLQTQGIAMFLTAMLPGSPFFRTDSFRLSAVALPTNSPSPASTTEFVVKVDRRGLAGEIALALEGLPAGVMATVNPIASDKNEAAIRLRVTDAAETGKEHTFHVTGNATHNDRIWRQKTQPVTLFIAAPEKETAAAPAAPATPVPPAK